MQHLASSRYYIKCLVYTTYYGETSLLQTSEMWNLYNKDTILCPGVVL